MSSYLSVIIPVFNVEKYLHQCLDSIINQKFRVLEIIIVNDGSTDRSPQICDEFAAKDNRIKVIHQQNSGVSTARNKGIEAATGQYVTFVDSDDWLEDTMYERMFKSSILNDYPDINMCDFKTISHNNTVKISSDLRDGFYEKSQIINEIYPTLLVTEDFGRIPIISTCICLFQRSFLIENNLKFDGFLRYSEDCLFMANVMLKAKTFYYLKGSFFYNYRQYEESRSKKFQEGWWINLVYLNQELKKLLKDNQDFDFRRQVKLQLLHSAFLVISNIAMSKVLSVSEKIKKLRNIFQQKELVEVFENLHFKKPRIMLRFVLYLIQYKMAKTYLVYHRTLSLLKNV